MKNHSRRKKLLGWKNFFCSRRKFFKKSLKNFFIFSSNKFSYNFHEKFSSNKFVSNYDKTFLLPTSKIVRTNDFHQSSHARKILLKSSNMTTINNPPNFLLLFSASIGLEANPTHHTIENNLEIDRHPVGFLTIGQKYSYAIGSTVILPCKINETGEQGVLIF
jgi:hypothetical protein